MLSKDRLGLMTAVRIVTPRLLSPKQVLLAQQSLPNMWRGKHVPSAGNPPTDTSGKKSDGDPQNSYRGRYWQHWMLRSACMFHNRGRVGNSFLVGCRPSTSP